LDIASSKGWGRALTAVVLAALVARGAVLAGPLRTPGRGLDDPDNYLPLARALAGGKGFTLDGRPTAYRPPLYPSALAPFGLGSGSFLLYPAQFWPHKNHVTLVDALARLRERGSPLKLVFTGSDKGNRSHVERYVAERGLSESVLFVGFVEAAVLQQLYLAAAALLFGSLMGPDNLPPLEAMAHGCPVVCASYAGAHEQLGEAALFFEGLDAAGAAAQIERLTDPELRAKLVSRGRELVRSRDVDGYIGRVMQVLDEIAQVRRLWAPGNAYRHL